MGEIAGKLRLLTSSSKALAAKASVDSSIALGF
jgi:hypothetical protein